MRARLRRWVVAAALVAAAEAALLASGRWVLLGSQALRTSALGLVSSTLSEIGSVLPAGFTEGLAAIVGILGAGWWQEHLIGPTLAGGRNASVSTLGAALAGPLYLLARHAAHARRERRSPSRYAPPHRVYLPVVAKGAGPRSSDASRVVPAPVA